MTLGIFTWLHAIDPAVATLTGIIVLIGLICVPVVKGIRRAKRFGAKVESGMDSLLGYGPIVDQTTGKVLQEAVPSMAIRVDKIETAILSLAETQKQIVEIQSRLTNLEDWREHHQEWSEQQHPQIVQHLYEPPK